ncbi:unnamed protein product [Mytilus coruscus]|uniref:Uncharacterized protein n=1 Tax=Mytilus coruscus TaxID=42192 RepID=A0A6J8BLX6_MYTCO|nr:unnamed protein product [Mytilus coruscus]
MATTESDSELININDDIPSGQQTRRHQIIPINFNLGNLEDDIIDDTDSQVIDNCIGKVDELLSRRHYTATLTRDLRRFKEDELPNYARIHKASFSPQLSSTETEHYFKGKVTEFNKQIRMEFREFMLKASNDYSEKIQSNCEQLWREACANIKNGNNIPKLNNKVQETKEKLADEYRKTASKAMNKEDLGKNTKETDIEKIKQELEVLKRKTQREGESEIVKLKREMEELKNSMKINNRSNRFNNNVYNHRGAFRGRRRQYDY